MIRKFTVAIGLLMIMILAVTMQSFACTEVYVGKEASDDGSIIIARSNDYQQIWPNYIDVVEGVENEEGRSLPIDENGSVLVPIKATTYKYQTTPWMDYTTAINGCTRDGSCGSNEKGVVMTMSVTAFSNASALEADPLVEGGLAEQAASDIVLSQAATAREGIEILAGIIDEYGNGQINIAIIADRDEAWYMEMYTGHQYAAVKLPDDEVAVFGNEFTLEYLSDYEDSICSENLQTLPAEQGWAVTDESKGLNLYETYSGSSMTKEYSHSRTWIGHKILAPSEYGDYDDSTLYPLTFAADEKVSFKDVTDIIRNRFEGTEFSPDETGKNDARVIGTDTAMSVHVLQIYPDLPEEICAVTWECTGPAVYGVFVPVSNACDEVADAYGRNQPAQEKDDYNFPTELYPWYAIKELNTIGMLNPERYGQPVRNCFAEAEAEMYEGLAEALEAAADIYESSAEDAKKILEDYCIKVQTAAFSDTQTMLSKVRWYESFCSNTLKVAKNPETGEYTDELKVYDPVELEIDLSSYSFEE